ncbi:MAG: KEOPS complex subunit Pcc1 [archaeon]
MKAKIIFELSDPSLIAKSLKPDTVKRSKRVKEDVKSDGKRLVVTLEAADLSSLKASVNSYLSFLQMSTKFTGGEK